ncbi:hypothetical protein BCR33DRAFT_728066 [Rhizoclosmatium globosum]|uniref:Uncharacterized protein n=1 Tax=Rhizoclosmatium globosum TaxID=329046 RepID=A0A1Y2ALM0_9FUNG|nr:hypothetical protein BCR33DRAFT_728066 [Rhizoclosmatium globosum]|eukprot:ORY23463.1 hypothetical protein BCR33DRAFT_728066 [Rhizoclosmatium globosum]
MPATPSAPSTPSVAEVINTYIQSDIQNGGALNNMLKQAIRDAKTINGDGVQQILSELALHHLKGHMERLQQHSMVLVNQTLENAIQSIKKHATEVINTADHENKTTPKQAPATAAIIKNKSSSRSTIDKDSQGTKE